MSWNTWTGMNSWRFPRETYTCCFFDNLMDKFLPGSEIGSFWYPSCNTLMVHPTVILELPHESHLRKSTASFLHKSPAKHSLIGTPDIPHRNTWYSFPGTDSPLHPSSRNNPIRLFLMEHLNKPIHSSSGNSCIQLPPKQTIYLDLGTPLQPPSIHPFGTSRQPCASAILEHPPTHMAAILEHPRRESECLMVRLHVGNSTTVGLWLVIGQRLWSTFVKLTKCSEFCLWSFFSEWRSLKTKAYGTYRHLN